LWGLWKPNKNTIYKYNYSRKTHKSQIVNANTPTNIRQANKPEGQI